MSETHRSDDGPTGQPSRQLEPRSAADGVRDDQAKPAGSAAPPDPPDPLGAAVVGGGGDTTLCTGPTGASAVRVSATTGAFVPVPDPVGAAVSSAASGSSALQATRTTAHATAVTAAATRRTGVMR